MAKKQKVENVVVIQQLVNGRIKKATKRYPLEEFALAIYGNFAPDIDEEQIIKLTWYDRLFKTQRYFNYNQLQQLKEINLEQSVLRHKLIYEFNQLLEKDTKNTSKKKRK